MQHILFAVFNVTMYTFINTGMICSFDCTLQKHDHGMKLMWVKKVQTYKRSHHFLIYGPEYVWKKICVWLQYEKGKLKPKALSF